MMGVNDGARLFARLLGGGGVMVFVEFVGDAVRAAVGARVVAVAVLAVRVAS